MARSTRRRAAFAGAVLGALLLGSACSSTTESGTASTTVAPSSTSSPSSTGSPGTAGAGTTPPGTGSSGTLRILVTNDDGFDAAGIDAVVEGLRALPDTEVVVVAPATNQSGTGGQVTAGALVVTDGTTASGHPAKVVTGFPADSVVWALDQGGIGFTPDLVVSGINFGQNIGPVIELSGTVGAARAAGARGIPALAASQGIAGDPDWPASTALVVAWVTEHRAELLAGDAPTPAPVQNLNVPTCTTGTLRDLVEVPVATDAAGRDGSVSDCTGEPPAATDDIGAFITGFPSLSDLTV